MVSWAIGKLTLCQCFTRNCCVWWEFFFCISISYDKIKLFFILKDEVGYWCILFLTKSSVFKCKHLSLVFLRFWHYIKWEMVPIKILILSFLIFADSEKKTKMSEVKTSMKRQNMIETYKRWVGRERGMWGEAEGGEICRHCYCLNLLVDTSKRSQNFVSHLNWLFQTLSWLSEIFSV